LDTQKSDKNKEKHAAEEVISRRVFVGGMAAAAGVMIVPRNVLGGPGYTAPSDKLNIAGVGVGGMGSNNLRQCASTENIVALCDVDDNLAARAYKTYPNAKTYRDFRIMLDTQKDIDAVIVATPDHNHAVIAMACMKLGKHVYVQKPLTRTIWEARMLTEAAKKYNVVTQMGNQGHSGPGVRLIDEWIANGAIGKVHEVHSWTNRPIWPQGMPRPTDTPAVPAGLDWDLWIGPSPMRPYNPAYHPWSWRSWWDFGAGALGDMACHVMDATYTTLKLGYPTSVEASIAYQFVPPAPGERGYGKRLEYHDSFPIASKLHYTFPARSSKYPAINYYWYDGGLLPNRPEELEPDLRLPESGTIFVGEKGKLICETYSESPRLIPATKMTAYLKKHKKKETTKLPSHEQIWIGAIKNKSKATSDFSYAGPFTETVLLGNLAIWFAGKRLQWDGPNMNVTNLPEANDLVKPKYREGWSL
jgi:predicted dehydrogenase